MIIRTPWLMCDYHHFMTMSMVMPIYANNYIFEHLLIWPTVPFTPLYSPHRTGYLAGGEVMQNDLFPLGNCVALWQHGLSFPLMRLCFSSCYCDARIGGCHTYGLTSTHQNTLFTSVNPSLMQYTQDIYAPKNPFCAKLWKPTIMWCHMMNVALRCLTHSGVFVGCAKTL